MAWQERKRVWQGHWDSLGSRPTWLRRERRLDLTGDDSGDLVVLEVRGERPESLYVELSAMIGGEQITLSRWKSGYELVDPPFPRDTTPDVVGSYLKVRFQQVLDGVEPDTVVAPLTFAYLDPGTHQDSMAFLHYDHDVDSVSAIRLLAGLGQKRFRRVRYSFGYESSVEQVWVPELRRFLMVYACC